MSELILGLIILALLAGFGWFVRETNKRETKLINALLSKTPQDLANLTLADNTRIEPEINKPDPDLVPFDQLNEEAFDKHIQSVLSNDTLDQEVV